MAKDSEVVKTTGRHLHKGGKAVHESDHQITTMTPLEKEAQKYATITYFPKITNKVVNIFANV
jgi:hypothetical protein